VVGFASNAEALQAIHRVWPRGVHTVTPAQLEKELVGNHPHLLNTLAASNATFLEGTALELSKLAKSLMVRMIP
jgi:hypothetical protein